MELKTFLLETVHHMLSFVSPACEDVLTPAAVAEAAMKVLNSCLADMPAGK